jgi:hypothetical protein
MDFDLETTIDLLSRTPEVLRAWLGGLPAEWTMGGGDEGKWSPYDVVGHFIHGELTDWIPRAEIILGEGRDKRFVPFDRLAQFAAGRERPLGELLATFATLRAQNLARLRSFHLKAADFELTGVHPELGTVTLGELLATWAAHDQNHLAQIAAGLAGRYQNQVGPWREYLGILSEKAD